MVRMAAVVAVVDTFCRLTVNADRLARVRNCACERIAASLVKAFTARVIAVTGMFSTYHNVAFTAAMVFVIGTI